MAIAFDTSVDGGLNTYTWNHTCSGSNRILFVAASNPGNASGTTATYNGVSMTALYRGDINAGETDIWYLINPSSGTNSIVCSGYTNFHGLSSSFTGVKQTGFPDSSINGAPNSNPFTQNTTVVASNCWIIGVGLATIGTSSTLTTNRTDRQTGVFLVGAAVITLSDSNGTVGTGSQGFTWTAGGGAAPTQRSAIVISIAPVLPVNRNFFSFM